MKYRYGDAGLYWRILTSQLIRRCSHRNICIRELFIGHTSISVKPYRNYTHISIISVSNTLQIRSSITYICCAFFLTRQPSQRALPFFPRLWRTIWVSILFDLCFFRSVDAPALLTSDITSGSSESTGHLLTSSPLRNRCGKLSAPEILCWLSWREGRNE